MKNKEEISLYLSNETKSMMNHSKFYVFFLFISVVENLLSFESIVD